MEGDVNKRGCDNTRSNGGGVARLRTAHGCDYKAFIFDDIAVWALDPTTAYRLPLATLGTNFLALPSSDHWAR